MDRASFIPFVVFVVIGLCVLGFSRWRLSEDARADRIDAGTSRCEQAVLDELPAGVRIDTGDEWIETATIDGDMVVSVRGDAVGWQSVAAFTCTIRHDGVWASHDGWQTPEVVIDE